MLSRFRRASLLSGRRDRRRLQRHADGSDSRYDYDAGQHDDQHMHRRALDERRPGRRRPVRNFDLRERRSAGAEYALIPFYGTTLSSATTTLDFTAAGTASPERSAVVDSVRERVARRDDILAGLPTRYRAVA